MIITVVLPAFNCEATLARTIANIPRHYINNIILVDDCSTDETLKVAYQIGLEHIISHPLNLGYGANQKTCYNKALEIGSDIIIMLHPDFQYDPALIPEMIRPLQTNDADIVLGSRLLKGFEAVKRGMPLYKYIGNRALTKFQNMIFKQTISEYHTGYRAFTRKALTAINYNDYPNTFIFDNILLINLLKKKIKIAEIYCPARYGKDCSSINFFDSVQYGLGVIYQTIRFIFLKHD